MKLAEKLKVAQLIGKRVRLFSRREHIRYYGHAPRPKITFLQTYQIGRRTKLRDFEQLESIDEDTKKRVRPSLRKHLHLYELSQIFIRRFETRVLSLIVCMLIINYFLNGVLTNELFPSAHIFDLFTSGHTSRSTSLHWADEPSFRPVFIGVGATFAASTIAFNTTTLLVQSRLHRLPTLLFRAIMRSYLEGLPMLIIVVMTTVYFRSQAASPTMFRAFALLGAMGVVSTLITIRLYGIICGVFRFLYSQYFNRTHLDSLVVVVLLEMLTHLEKNPYGWGQSSFRRWQAIRLEQIAQVIEHDLPTRTRNSDYSTVIWEQTIALQIATGFRRMERWLYVPRQDTFAFYRERLAETLIYILNGSWDSLERAEPEVVPRRKLLRATILNLFNTFFVAALPGLVFMLIRKPLEIQASYTGPIGVGVFVWAALALMFNLDPNLKEKVEMFKETMTIIPYGGKSKEKKE